MAILHIRLLGGFSAEIPPIPLTKFRSTKSRALLAWLASNPDVPHSRSIIATLLWGDLDEAAAKTNLRVTLSRLKRELDMHPALVVTRSDVLFDSRLAKIDVQQFVEGVALVGNESATLDAAISAIDLYHGNFLTGLELDDAPQFEAWRRNMQERLHQQMMRTLDWLRERHHAAEDWPQLAQMATRQLGVVAWHEAAQRSLLLALVRQGQLPAARAQYARCRTVLAEELGVEPAAETETLWRSLTEPTVKATNPNNLPQGLTPFFGRIEILNEINQALFSRDYRLLTVTGLGGSGKTRLALEAARVQLGNFADGVWFVALAGVDSAEAVIPAIAAALDIELDKQQPDAPQLHAALKTEERLLVLDNLEQLPDSAADQLTELLQVTERLVILTTSRRRLGLRIEQLFPINGLAFPNADAPSQSSADFPALRFFVSQLRRIDPIEPLNKTAIVDICRLIDGLPLGIELAAAQSEQRPLYKVANTLRRTLRQLETTMRDVPARQRSLRAVFESSWVLLTRVQQRVLARLAVFRGGFSAESALAVVDECTVAILDELTGHSLLRLDEDGRFGMHELVREFSAEKRPVTDPTPNAHSDYYLKSINRRYTLDERRIDLNNIRAAWRFAIDQADLPHLQAHAHALATLILASTTLNEAISLIALARQAVSNRPVSQQRQETLAHLLYAHFSIAWRTGVSDEILVQLNEALAMTRSKRLKSLIHGSIAYELGDRGQQTLAQAHYALQESYARQLADPELIVRALTTNASEKALHFVGKYDVAIEQLQEATALIDANQPKLDLLKERVTHAQLNVFLRHGDYARGLVVANELLALGRSRGSKVEEADALLYIGLLSDFAGRSQQSIAAYLKALPIFKETGDVIGQGLTTINLGLSYRHNGDPARAKAYGEKGLALFALSSNLRMEGQGRNRLAHTLYELGQLAESHAAYQAADSIWQPQEHPNGYEALAGLALTSARLGYLDEAARLVDKVLAFAFANNLHKVVEPALLMLNCAGALAVLGRDDEVQAALRLAYDWMDTIAERISDDEMREHYLQRCAHLRLREHLDMSRCFLASVAVLPSL